MLKSTAKWIIQRVGNTQFNKKRIARRLAGVDRINAGCGDIIVRNWLNVGFFPFHQVPYGTLKKVNNAYLLHFDLTQGLPLHENSLRFIYAGHFIEHLSFEQGIVFLKRCCQAMREGGIIRLTCPDLELWVRKYYENDLDFFKEFYRIFPSLPDLKTKGQILVRQFQGWGHRWLYDFGSLEDILRRSGFSHIGRKRAFDSAIPDIEKLEASSEGRLLETLYAEAMKAPEKPAS
jgi:predicted SAM-dependent methyltransferase